MTAPSTSLYLSFVFCCCTSVYISGWWLRVTFIVGYVAYLEETMATWILHLCTPKCCSSIYLHIKSNDYVYLPSVRKPPSIELVFWRWQLSMPHTVFHSCRALNTVHVIPALHIENRVMKEHRAFPWATIRLKGYIRAHQEWWTSLCIPHFLDAWLQFCSNE